MSFKDQPYYRKFESLLKQVSDELEKINKEKSILLQENHILRKKLDELENGNQGLFAHLPENEKRAMRGEITDLIRRVDRHISKQ